MSLVVNTNVGSLTAQRSLASASNLQSEAMERLSTGSRINSASDDAAGLAIVSRMDSQINGLTMAVKNANDGISLTQSIEGALVEVTDMLQRLRELSVQASNDTNTGVDRRYIQDEVDLLVAEVTRISENTRYNGQEILDGSFAARKLQVGTEAGEYIQFSVEDTAATSIGAYQTLSAARGPIAASSSAATATNPTTAADTITIDANAGSKTITPVAGDSARQVAIRINEVRGDTGVSAEAHTYAKLSTDSTTDQRSTISINGQAIRSFTHSTQGAADAITKINEVTSITGVHATLMDDNSIMLFDADGDDIVVENKGSNTLSLATLDYNGDVVAGLAAVTLQASTDASGASPVAQVSGVSGISPTSFSGNTVISDGVNSITIAHAADVQEVTNIEVRNVSEMVQTSTNGLSTSLSDGTKTVTLPDAATTGMSTVDDLVGAFKGELRQQEWKLHPSDSLSDIDGNLVIGDLDATPKASAGATDGAGTNSGNAITLDFSAGAPTTYQEIVDKAVAHDSYSSLNMTVSVNAQGDGLLFTAKSLLDGTGKGGVAAVQSVTLTNASELDGIFTLTDGVAVSAGDPSNDVQLDLSSSPATDINDLVSKIQAHHNYAQLAFDVSANDAGNELVFTGRALGTSTFTNAAISHTGGTATLTSTAGTTSVTGVAPAASSFYAHIAHGTDLRGADGVATVAGQAVGVWTDGEGAALLKAGSNQAVRVAEVESVSGFAAETLNAISGDTVFADGLGNTISLDHSNAALLGETREYTLEVTNAASQNGILTISDGQAESADVTVDFSSSQPSDLAEMVSRIQSADGYSNLAFSVELTTDANGAVTANTLTLKGKVHGVDNWVGDLASTGSAQIDLDTTSDGTAVSTGADASVSSLITEIKSHDNYDSFGATVAKADGVLRQQDFTSTRSETDFFSDIANQTLTVSDGTNSVTVDIGTTVTSYALLATAIGTAITNAGDQMAFAVTADGTDGLIFKAHAANTEFNYAAGDANDLGAGFRQKGGKFNDQAFNVSLTAATLQSAAATVTTSVEGSDATLQWTAIESGSAGISMSATSNGAAPGTTSVVTRGSDAYAELNFDMAKNSNGISFDATAKTAGPQGITPVLSTTSAATIGPVVETTPAAGSVPTDIADLVAQIQGASDYDKLAFTVAADGNGGLSFTYKEGGVVSNTATMTQNGVAQSVSVATLGSNGASLDTSRVMGTMMLSSSNAWSVSQSGSDNATSYFDNSGQYANLTTVSTLDLKTQGGAQSAIAVLDGAIEKISSMRAELGAIENRLDHTVSNLMNISENTSAARSRIEDADFSVESANLAKSQVLLQAGTAMLAQANAAPQMVLQLLQ